MAGEIEVRDEVEKSTLQRMVKNTFVLVCIE